LNVGIALEKGLEIDPQNERLFMPIPFKVTYAVVDRASGRTRPKEDSPVYALDHVFVTIASTQFHVPPMQGCLVANEDNDPVYRYSFVFAAPLSKKVLPAGTLHQQSRWGHSVCAQYIVEIHSVGEVVEIGASPDKCI
jgi:hypothetical protein